MVIGQDTDLVFNADELLEQPYIVEVIRAEKGIFPVGVGGGEARHNEERNAVQVEWENLSRNEDSNRVDTMEIKQGRGKLYYFMQAWQEIGIKSLSDIRKQRYWEVVRKVERIVSKDGREFGIWYTAPKRRVDAAEAAAAKARRDAEAQPLEDFAEDSGTIEAAANGRFPTWWEEVMEALKLFDGQKSLKVIQALALKDPAVTADADFKAAVESGEYVTYLLEEGKIKKNSRGYLVTA